MKELPVDFISCFYHEFSISATYHSNAIEGNTFTYDEVKMLLERGITTSNRSFREHEEIVGYKKTFDYLLDAFKNKVEITEDFIKKIHFYVEGKESSGEYRTI